MKKLKTITAILVLSLMTFSCQTDEELLEVQILKESSQEQDSRFGGVGNNTVSILLDFNDIVTFEQINLFRNYYASHFGLQSDFICDKDSKTYIWEIDFVTEDRFDVLVDTIPDLPTGVSDPNDGGIGTIGEFVTFQYDSDCQ